MSELTKIEYFKLALSNRLYTKKRWVYSAFAIMETIEDPSDMYHLKLKRTDDGYDYWDAGSGEYFKITDAIANEPLLNKRDKFEITSKELRCVKKSVSTQVGIALWNAICNEYPFDGLFPYISDDKPINIIEQYIADSLVDEPEDGVLPEGKISYEHVIKYHRGIYSLEGYSKIFVPTYTDRSLLAAPDAIKRMNELLIEHKGNLTNQATMAKIMAEIAELDREWINGDPDAGFYLSDKAFMVIRMKKFYLHGIEESMDGSSKHFIRNSLEAGWDIEDLPYLANAIKNGSFSRGALTALGGEKTKTILRMLSGVTVDIEDCETKVGIDVLLTKDNLSKYIGSYIVGSDKPITSDSKELINKSTVIRSPGYCIADGNTYCIRCMGEFIRGNENSTGALAAQVGSKLMLMYMKLMHGKQLKTRSYSFFKELS